MVNPRILLLYDKDQFTRIHFELCNSLKTPLAQWLFRFYSTHAKAYAYKIATIHNLCGSEAKSINDFKKNTLIKALEEVKKVSAIFGKKFEYKIEDGLLEVTNSLSVSQQKHLLKKSVGKLPS